jgi:hypothetical protein
MNADPTITLSLDHLVEFSDDSKHPEQPEADVIMIPPVSQGTGPSSTPGTDPAPDAQP